MKKEDAKSDGQACLVLLPFLRFFIFTAQIFNDVLPKMGVTGRVGCIIAIISGAVSIVYNIIVAIWFMDVDKFMMILILLL